MKRTLTLVILVSIILGVTTNSFAKNTLGLEVGGAILDEKMNFISSIYYNRELNINSSIGFHLSYLSDFNEKNIILSRVTYKYKVAINEKIGLGIIGGISSYIYQPALFLGGSMDFTLKDRYIFILDVSGSAYLYLGNNLPLEPGIDIDTSFTFKYLISSKIQILAKYSYVLGQVHSFGIGIQYSF